MRTLVALYRANPFRPHCQPGHHVLLCRLVAPHMTQPFCGPID